MENRAFAHLEQMFHYPYYFQNNFNVKFMLSKIRKLCHDLKRAFGVKG